MALTPEDVVNKRFQPTKFREGYDQDEVDDFLDEVVVELRRLNGENEELRQQLASSGSRSEEAPAAVAPVPSFAEPVAAVPAPVVAAPVAAAAVEDEQTSTTNLLQLARRLHEEHVREGIEKRDALIAEGHATAARVVAEAEAKQRAQIGALDAERQGLETRIDELRNFERDYRSKLKGYIEGQLRELDASGGASTAPAAAQTFGSPVSASGDQQAPSFQGFGA
ncbi:cell division protein [Leifsonia sp. Leaf325]|nr:DivIVA domain-containing protein [Leifsonia sp. Leaf325]KQQ95490.1 cell division protein [Leifsonia sp. Leaf325]